MARDTITLPAEAVTINVDAFLTKLLTERPVRSTVETIAAILQEDADSIEEDVCNGPRRGRTIEDIEKLDARWRKLADAAFQLRQAGLHIDI